MGTLDIGVSCSYLLFEVYVSMFSNLEIIVLCFHEVLLEYETRCYPRSTKRSKVLNQALKRVILLVAPVPRVAIGADTRSARH